MNVYTLSASVRITKYREAHGIELLTPLNHDQITELMADYAADTWQEGYDEGYAEGYDEGVEYGD